MAIRDAAYDSAVAAELMGEMLVELNRRYGPGDFGSVDARFAEVKRMFVRATYLRRGIGGAVLAAIEARARELGYRELRLETGTRQPEAIGLYRSSGWSAIPCFPPYADDPLSVCFVKSLVDVS